MSSNKKYKGKECVFFREEKEIGHGGNGTVYNAKLLEDGGRNIDYPLVAKFFTYDKDSKEKAKRYSRFRNEVQVLKQYKGIDGIIEIIDMCCPENVPDHLDEAWYLMPKAKEYKFNKRRLLNQKLDDMISLAFALQKLHDKKLAHRDIKPGNILILNGKIVLSDFGLIWGVSDERLTEIDESIGPYKIMPPELEHVQPDMNLEFMPSDVYLFAKVLWMNLKNDNIGFRGRYNRGDDQIYLDKSHYGVCTLEPIHKLIEEATYDDMNKRITIDKCIEYLRLQREIYNETGQVSEEVLKQLQYDEESKRITEKNSPDEKVYADIGVICEMLQRVIPNAEISVKDKGRLDEKPIKITNFNVLTGNTIRLLSYFNGKKVCEYMAKIKKMVCNVKNGTIEIELDDFPVEDFDNASYDKGQNILEMMTFKEYFSANQQIIISKPRSVHRIENII